jgi:hypothetical protein
MFLSCLSVSVTILISSFHCWINIITVVERLVISCHVRFHSTRHSLVHIQQSEINKYWYNWRFVPWDSVHFPWVGKVSNSKQLQYLVVLYKHVACNTQKNCLIYNMKYCGMLQITNCSFSLNPSLLLYHILHISTCIHCIHWCVFWLLCLLNDLYIRCSRMVAPHYVCAADDPSDDFATWMTYQGPDFDDMTSFTPFT